MTKNTKKILTRIIIGAILGIIFGFFIDYSWTLVSDKYFIINNDDTSQFFAGILFIFTLPTWIFQYTPLAWGLIGSLLGYYASSKEKIFNVFIIFGIFLLIGTYLGYDMINQHNLHRT